MSAISTPLTAIKPAVTKAPSTLSKDMTAAKNAVVAFLHGAVVSLAATSGGAASATNLLNTDLEGWLAAFEAYLTAKLGATWGPVVVGFVSDAVQAGLPQIEAVLSADGLGAALTGLESIAGAFGLIPVASSSQTSSATPGGS